ILDGPAVLGLADCRMLGRVVDASILVVRWGRQGLRPLRRAKEMLEQSQVRLAGIVFNAISDGIEDWSSYAPGLATVEESRSFDRGRAIGSTGSPAPRQHARS